MQLLKQLMELSTGDNRIIVGLLDRAFRRWEVKFTFNGHPVHRGLVREAGATIAQIMSTMIKFRDKYATGLDKAHAGNYPRNRILLCDPAAKLVIVLSFDFSEKENHSRAYDAGVVTIFQGPVDEFWNDPGHANASTVLYV